MKRSSNNPPLPPVFPALLDLYFSGSLADVCLTAGEDGQSEEEEDRSPPIKAHKAVLAASSGYFRALFAGAGASMMMISTSSSSSSLSTVRLPSLTRQQLESVLEWIYSCGERAAFFTKGRRKHRRGGKGGTAAPATTAAAADPRRRSTSSNIQGRGRVEREADLEEEEEEEAEAAEAASSTAAAGAALAAADFLDVPRLRAAALAALRSRLSPRTALQALALSASCEDCGDLYQASLAMAQARFSEVVMVAAAAAATESAASANASSSSPTAASSSPEAAVPARGSLFSPSPPPTPPPPGASSSSASSSISAAAAAAAAALASLPPHALLDLLRGDALDARDEAEVLSVAMAWCDAGGGALPASLERRAWAPQLLGCCRAAPADLAASAGVLALLHPERRKKREVIEENETAAATRPSFPFSFSKGTREAFADALAQAAAGPARPPPAPRGFGGVGVGVGAGGTGGPLGGSSGFLCPPFSGRALVACGGHDDGWRPFRTTEVYDPIVDEWSPGPMAPAPLPFAAAAVS